MYASAQEDEIINLKKKKTLKENHSKNKSVFCFFILANNSFALRFDLQVIQTGSFYFL